MSELDDKPGPGELGTGVRIGVPRSGKTLANQDDVFASVLAGLPVLALDPNHSPDWNRPRLPVELLAQVPSIAAADRAVKQGKRLVVVRPDDCDPEHLMLEAAEWAITRGRDSHRGLCVPEAHNFLPNSRTKLPRPVQKSITAWYHQGVRLWLDTQRFAMLNRTAIDSATVRHIHALAGTADMREVRDLGGPHLAEAVEWCARQMKGWRAVAAGQPPTPEAPGERGWHVTVGLVTLPPFVARRVGDERTRVFG